MKTFADHRGIALIFDDLTELDGTIKSLTRLRESKKQTGKPYPAVYIYTDRRMPDEDALAFHDEAWWMGFAVLSNTSPPTPLDKLPEDN